MSLGQFRRRVYGLIIMVPMSLASPLFLVFMPIMGLFEAESIKDYKRGLFEFFYEYFEFMKNLALEGVE